MPGSTRKPFSIGGTTIRAGERAWVDIPVTRQYTHNEIHLTTHVIHGRKAGPTLFVSAAIHGDEINGVEIIRRLLALSLVRRLRGTLIAVPVVNLHGFISTSRYLPDGRDLNRSFPGSNQGSLASRLASILMEEVVGQATHGIDLHTGAQHRSNLPQIRANLDDAATASLARAFGVPVLINSRLRDGSLRESAADRGIPMLVYEGGESLRYDEWAIRPAVRGIVDTMRAIGMLPERASKSKSTGQPMRRVKARDPFVARSNRWVRAPVSGVLRASAELGRSVAAGDLLGVICDPFGQLDHPIYAQRAGLVIGRTRLPLVNEGDGIYHIAHFEQLDEVATALEGFDEAEPLRVDEAESE